MTENDPGAQILLAFPCREIIKPHAQCSDEGSRPRYSTLLIKKEGETIWNKRTLHQQREKGKLARRLRHSTKEPTAAQARC